MVQTTQNFELYIKSKQINIHSNSITLYGTKLHLTSPLCNSDSFHGEQIHLLSCQLSKTFLPPLSIRGLPLRKSFSLLRSKFYLLRVEPFSKGALCTGKWSKLYPFVRMAKKKKTTKKIHLSNIFSLNGDVLTLSSRWFSFHFGCPAQITLSLNKGWVIMKKCSYFIKKHMQAWRIKKSCSYKINTCHKCEVLIKITFWD